MNIVDASSMSYFGRDIDEYLYQLSQSVIPAEPHWRREPESINTYGDYGFRARGLRTQVGCRRLGQYHLPISGKPEIGGPGMTSQNLCGLVSGSKNFSST